MTKRDGIHRLAEAEMTLKGGKEALKKQAYSCKQCASCREWNWTELDLPGFEPGITKAGFVICPVFRHSTGFQSDFAQGKVKLVEGLVDRKVYPSHTLVEKLFQCTQCASCTEFCPQARVEKLDPAEVIRSGRGLVQELGVSSPKAIQIMTHRPSEPKHLPDRWISKNAGTKTNSKLAYFPGCVFGASFKQPTIATSMISIMDSLDEEFQVITDGFCCGYPAFTSGDTQKAAEHARFASERLNDLSVQTLVVSCAYGFRMFKKEYPVLLGEALNVRVLHAVEFLEEEVNSGRLKLTGGWDVVATYHDPCQLGRRCGVYEQPRNLASAIPGLELVEMTENRHESLCSGGGGGVEAAYPELSKRIAMTRVRQAEETGADVIFTACPYCRSSLWNGISGLGSKLQVVDIVEAVAISAEINK